jgi:NAD(P)-dependent dehydrogenase (short-subunit alcohol dehydrogenase family)
MKIAITGGTGFVGSHLASRLATEGHDLVLLARQARLNQPGQVLICDLADVNQLKQAFNGCDAVAHCAGINREIGSQTFQSVHVEATANVVEAAKAAGVEKIVLMSFLRARPNCDSPYHESKWGSGRDRQKLGTRLHHHQGWCGLRTRRSHARSLESRASHISSLRVGRSRREKRSTAGHRRPCSRDARGFG